MLVDFDLINSTLSNRASTLLLIVLCKIILLLGVLSQRRSWKQSCFQDLCHLHSLRIPIHIKKTSHINKPPKISIWYSMITVSKHKNYDCTDSFVFCTPHFNHSITNLWVKSNWKIGCVLGQKCLWWMGEFWYNMKNRFARCGWGEFCVWKTDTG